MTIIINIIYTLIEIDLTAKCNSLIEFILYTSRYVDWLLADTNKRDEMVCNAIHLENIIYWMIEMEI